MERLKILKAWKRGYDLASPDGLRGVLLRAYALGKIKRSYDQSDYPEKFFGSRQRRNVKRSA